MRNQSKDLSPRGNRRCNSLVVYGILNGEASGPGFISFDITEREKKGSLRSSGELSILRAGGSAIHLRFRHPNRMRVVAGEVDRRVLQMLGPMERCRYPSF